MELRDPQGRLHSQFTPALKTLAGTEEWYFEGQRHRLGGPAVQGPNLEEWWYHGQKHREDGPAYIDEEVKMWIVKGELHRLEWPAVLYNDGRQKWYKRGQLHREDRPAVINSPTDFEYWLEGKKVTEREMNRSQMKNVLHKINNIKKSFTKLLILKK
jgi:hypothetical protein